MNKKSRFPDPPVRLATAWPYSFSAYYSDQEGEKCTPIGCHASRFRRDRLVVPVGSACGRREGRGIDRRSGPHVRDPLGILPSTTPIPTAAEPRSRSIGLRVLHTYSPHTPSTRRCAVSNRTKKSWLSASSFLVRLRFFCQF